MAGDWLILDFGSSQAKTPPLRAFGTLTRRASEGGVSLPGSAGSPSLALRVSIRMRATGWHWYLASALHTSPKRQRGRTTNQRSPDRFPFLCGPLRPWRFQIEFDSTAMDAKDRKEKTIPSAKICAICGSIPCFLHWPLTTLPRFDFSFSVGSVCSVTFVIQSKIQNRPWFRRG
jgi:hypothetical protein